MKGPVDAAPGRSGVVVAASQCVTVSEHRSSKFSSPKSRLVAGERLVNGLEVVVRVGCEELHRWDRGDIGCERKPMWAPVDNEEMVEL